MATVGVLCARGRVEEKAIMAALAEAGIVSALFPPVDEPLPVGPLPVAPNGQPFPVPQIVVDRHQNRQIARAVLATCRALGVPALSAGIAATGDRLDVATALSAHGLPRPHTALCTSEAAALAAVEAIGLPATLLPLELHLAPVPLLDADAAEAVLEHRAVLGGSERTLGLIQAGAPGQGDLATVIVVDGMAWTTQSGHEPALSQQAIHLAEEAARALRADFIAVSVLTRGDSVMVWDVTPVPDFRHAVPLYGPNVAEVIATSVRRRLEALASRSLTPEVAQAWITISQEGILGDVVVSA